MGVQGGAERFLTNHYYNILSDLEKVIKASKNVNELKAHMEQFMNANRKVTWQHHSSGVFHKDEAEKALQKVASEFQRYIHNLEQESTDASSHDLLEALSIVESMADRIKGR